MSIRMWPVGLDKKEIENVLRAVRNFVIRNDEIYGIYLEDDGTIWSDKDYCESFGDEHGQCLWDVVRDALGENGAYARICDADATYYSMISSAQEKDFTDEELLTARIETVLAEMRNEQASKPGL